MPGPEDQVSTSTCWSQWLTLLALRSGGEGRASGTRLYKSFFFHPGILGDKNNWAKKQNNCFFLICLYLLYNNIPKNIKSMTRSGTVLYAFYSMKRG